MSAPRDIERFAGEEELSKSRRLLVEFRSYNLRPGHRGEFHHLVTRVSVPMLLESGTDVIAYGPSSDAADTYILIRAYEGLNELRASQASFYGSRAWKEGPREQLVALIVNQVDLVTWLSSATVNSIRRDWF